MPRRASNPAARATATPRPAGWAWLALLWDSLALAVALGGRLSGADASGVASLPVCALGIAGTLLLCRRLSWLGHVGTASMTIHVLHILAGSGVRVVIVRLHAPPDPGCSSASARSRA